jgi:hypothetical protein
VTDPIAPIPASPIAPLGSAPVPEAAPGAPAPVVNFDQGEHWGFETVPLKHPFQMKGVVYDKFVIRNASGNDVANYIAGNSNVAGFIAGLSGQNELTVRALHAEDYNVVARKVVNFLR